MVGEPGIQLPLVGRVMFGLSGAPSHGDDTSAPWRDDDDDDDDDNDDDAPYVILIHTPSSDVRPLPRSLAQVARVHHRRTFPSHHNPGDRSDRPAYVHHSR